MSETGTSKEINCACEGGNSFAGAVSLFGKAVPPTLPLPLTRPSPLCEGGFLCDGREAAGAEDGDEVVAGGAAILEAAGGGFVGIADGEAAAALEPDGDAAAFRHEALDVDEVDVGERRITTDARRTPAERHEHEVRREGQRQLKKDYDKYFSRGKK